MHSIFVALFLVLEASLASAAPHDGSGKQLQIRPRAGAAYTPPGTNLAGAPVNNVTISTSNVVQCSKATISWIGAVEPVSLYIAIGGLYVGETPVATINNLYGGSTSWTVNQASGKDLEFRITDSKNQVAYVQNLKIGGSPDASCLGGTSSASGSTAAASSEVTGTTWSSAWSDDQVWSDATTYTPEASASEIYTAAPTTTTVLSQLLPTTSTSSRVSTTTTATSVSTTTTAATTFSAGNAAAATPSKSGALPAFVGSSTLALVIALLSIVFTLTI